MYGGFQRPTRTVPGDTLQGLWWVNDNCYCYGQACSGSGCFSDREAYHPDVMIKRGTRRDGDKRDNFPMRSFNCRGKYFEGMTNHYGGSSERDELDVARGGASVGRQYYRYDSRSCVDNDL